MHRRKISCLLFALLTLSGIRQARAADPTPPQSPPAYKQLRYDEDYSYLRDPSQRSDLWDRIKFIPLDEKGDINLSLGGEVRERYEYFHNSNWGKGPQDDGGYLLQRYMVHADLHFGPDVRVFVQFKSGLEDGRTGGPRPTDEDDFDLNQAFLDLTANFDPKDSLTLRIGRQEMMYGSSRLVSVRESPNVRQSFDGARLIGYVADWRIDAFLTRPVDTNPGVFDDGPDNKRIFWGVYAVGPLPLLPGGHVDLYYLGLRREDAVFDQGKARELRHSIGTRLWGEKNGWDYNGEFVYQFGSFGDGDISAWTTASETGYTFHDAPWRPRLALKADVTSGDSNPNNPDLQTFNPLFPRGAYFSETALIGPANHIDAHPSVEVHPTKSMTVTLDWDFFWRESTHDAVYGNAVNVVRTGQTSSASYVGNQPQLLVEWRADRHLTLTAAYAHFFASDFLKQTPPGKDVDYVSTWATYKF